MATMETKLASSKRGVGEDTSQRPVAAEMECGASARRRSDARQHMPLVCTIGRRIHPGPLLWLVER